MKQDRTTIAAFSVAAALATLALGQGPGAVAAETRFVTIGTGGVTGVYYPAGGAICRLVNRNRLDHGVRCSPEATDGSVFNITAIRSEELDFGIVQSDVQAVAVAGRLDFKEAGPDPNLRAVFSLHAEPLHLVARIDAGIRRFEDLKNKRVNIGNPGSGQRATTELIFSILGWTTADFSLAAEIKSSDQSAAICDNEVDAVLFTVGIPSAAIKEVTSACDVRLVGLEGEWVERLVSEYPSYTKAVIPGGFYRNNTQDVPTFGPRATLVTSARIPETVVYNLVRAVFDGFDDFRRLHPALQDLEKEEMVKAGLSAPLHPGAARYFREAGLVR